MQKRRKTFKDTLLFTLFFLILAGFAGFMAALIYFLSLLGVR